MTNLFHVFNLFHIDLGNKLVEPKYKPRINEVMEVMKKEKPSYG